ncbi:exonuclease domain-containing protein [Sediminibacillus albus]|uniref:DNA polymerase-3 subunit epsilon n=1 Tax=Sediminibacillus albus TaxID=407036 RepID=A0A1G8WZ33_9BACI|nr:exonuclease domain-containing protein [Sediminibacillus albus]SDJ82780.1 DNA polymerase-3 subunit epsilon [Sediminibacillus albus]
MIVDQMIQFVKQMSGKLNAGPYTSLSNQTDPGKIAYMRELQREMKRKDILEVPFGELKVVVFDLETTGFYPYKGDHILSIGAVKMEGDHVIDNKTFYSPVHCETAPSQEIQQLTGLTEDVLFNADPIHDVLKNFYQFIKTDPLVAHHANHEKVFMKHAAWRALKMNFQHRIIDTSFLTRIVEPEAGLVTLDQCCAHYGIEIADRHHALHDALATAQLWAENIRLIQALGFKNLKDVYAHLAAK